MSFRYEEQFAGLQQGDVRGATILYGGKQNLLVASPELPSVSGRREALASVGSDFDWDQQTRAMPSHSATTPRGQS